MTCVRLSSPRGKLTWRIEKRSGGVRDSKCVKLWDWLEFPEQDETCSLAEKQLVGANWQGVLGNVMLRCLHINLSKIGLDR